jgi:DMSO/TMAO reductase YedYZ molybdopterin-dependent catalytic subunit
MFDPLPAFWDYNIHYYFTGKSAMLTRRRFLLTLSAAALTTAAACRPANVSPPTLYAPGGAPLTPTPTATPAAMPTTARTPEPIPGSVPITQMSKLYEKSFRGNPKPDTLEQWSLSIDGLVQTPLKLTLDDLRALPAVEEMRTLQCISNPVGGSLIGNVVWTGATLNELLARVGVNSACQYALFRAADGYTTSVERKWLEQPGVLLVYLANGEPLPLAHGYPVRLSIPGLYGQKMPKWITQITFSETDKLGYWEGEAYGWSNVAEVKTNSQIVTRERTFPTGQTIRLSGLAYAGKRAIRSVELAITGPGESLDSAAWLPVTMVAPPSPLAWMWWVYDWLPAQPGDYRVTVRATDEKGYTQSRPATGVFSGAFPDGTDALHALSVQIG